MAMPNCFELFCFVFAPGPPSLPMDAAMAAAGGPKMRQYHACEKPWLLKVEAAMDSENLFEGQAGLVSAALQEALPRLPMWPCCDSSPSESAPDQGQHGSTHGVFSRVAAF